MVFIAMESNNKRFFSVNFGEAYITDKSIPIKEYKVGFNQDLLSSINIKAEQNIKNITTLAYNMI